MSVPASASAPTPGEMAESRLWAAAKFEGKVLERPAQPGITVLANHDPVFQNTREGKPLKIGDRSFTRGLYCHAVSSLRVVLPGPAKSFQAVVGLDHNDDTRNGSGSVVFSVTCGANHLYRSPVMRFGTPAQKVNVPLGGAREFMLDVGDAGDGIGWDQSDWADAHVTLENGKTLWLGDMPLRTSPPKKPFTTAPPFGFTYDGKPFAQLVKDWPLERSSRKLDANRTERTLVWRDPATKLAMKCVSVEYADYPVSEWTVYLRNDGAADTPIIENVNSIDVDLPVSASPCVLRHWKGSPCEQDDYHPYADSLKTGEPMRIATSGGRPTNAAMPYFNVDSGDEGVILVVGWPGQWAATFDRTADDNLRVQAGQELTHFRLHPGEEVRGPLSVALFWQGDSIHAQNVWRRWMVAHNLPRPGGKLPPAQHVACSSHQYGEMIHADEASQKTFIDRYLAEGLKLDYWWMDAGWYPNKNGWPDTGTWEVDRTRFPNGLRAVTDHGRAKGVRSIVWFEPERVAPGTWLYENKPQWLLGKDGDQKLLNLGDSEAREWLTNHIDGLIVSEGIDLYRQDHNIDPLGFWRSADAPDRQGITEIKYVTGYLSYWDELRRRHPNMLIDTCASGGRRNDLETLRRAVPLLRSDYIFEPTGQQAHTYGIASWIPYFGTGLREVDPYSARSVLCSSINSCWDLRRKDLPYDDMRRLMSQWRSVADRLLGDYYPLTPYSLGDDAWMAWQFDRPEQGDGMVQAFRRPASDFVSARFRLHGLDPEAKYRVHDLDSSRTVVIPGKELMERGLLVSLEDRPSAAVIAYEKLP